MPHTQSAKKRLRQNTKHRLHNRSALKAIKVQLKKTASALETGTVENAQSEVRLAIKKLDKAASRRSIHPNKASHKKSQLAKALRNKETTPAKS
jgi:small subunit ribosomal protein S20